jgi:hypothetical protein
MLNVPAAAAETGVVWLIEITPELQGIFSEPLVERKRERKRMGLETRPKNCRSSTEENGFD